MSGTPIFDDLLATFQAGPRAAHTAGQPVTRVTSTQATPDDEPLVWSLTGRVITSAHRHG